MLGTRPGNQARFLAGATTSELEGILADPTRRAVIAAAASLPLVAVTGCSGIDVLASPPSPAPDVGLLREAITSEQLMVTWYSEVLRGSGNAGAAGGPPASLTAALEPLLAEHRAHLTQLRSRLIVPAGSASPSPSYRAPGAPVVPTAAGAAVAFLHDAEQAAATAMLDRLRGASPSLAQLFASISASEATHVPALTGAAREAAARAGT
jgi:Ferritin-like domain